jgi:[ribosomal protein S5]-alanine N-acetyltransferase
MKTLETERLLLRPFTNDDRDIHTVVFSNPDVCRYYCGKTRTPEETQEWLIHRKWQSRNEDELGFLAVVRKDDNQIMGLVALQLLVAFWLRFEDEPDTVLYPLVVELSYAFGREYQGQGYATEACQALIEFGFKGMRLPRLTNSIAPENIPSVRLCEKLGFRRVKTSIRKVRGTSGFWIILRRIAGSPSAFSGVS